MMAFTFFASWVSRRIDIANYIMEDLMAVTLVGLSFLDHFSMNNASIISILEKKRNKF